MALVQEKTGEKDEAEDLRKSASRDNLFIAVTAVLAGVFFIFIIYQIIISPEQMLPLIACGVALIVDIFLMIFSIQRKFELQKKIDEKKFDEMFAAQKASYFVLRKNFDELSQKLQNIEDSTNSLPANEIVNAQKALAKVTINRNKENTDALMNSNDVLVEKFIELEEKINGNNDLLVGEEKKLIDSTRDALIQNNQEIKYLLSDVSTEIKSLKADLKAIESQQRLAPQQPVMMAFQAMPQQMGMMPQMQPMQYVMNQPNIMNPEPVKSPKHENINTEETVPKVDDNPKSLAEQTPASAVEDIQVTKETSASKVEDMLAPESEEKPTSVAEEITIAEDAKEPAEEESISTAAEEPAAEEPAVEEIPLAEEKQESVAEKVLDEEQVQATEKAAPSIEETPAPQDPNRTMSPDEIAALFASMGGGDESTEDSPKEEIKTEEPKPDEEPIVEEKIDEQVLEEPSAESSNDVDMSDPNRQLSPDEIAKLFASMS